ncbi:TRAP transporter small permease [Psychromarinibacter sp. C21-152]|uniref:TRAP transporter small permease protein n=1 Tax=Psychromarinibacter sediminicola TaxID=3033385 RepID=A0AAE3NS96_9RHOB|nr:TRAP transporter small permease [Psychromarinibacter sediminicola]MDF0599612.1 TRAP transporter small permease [Psychromarinibacter sediminicola]
MTDRSDPPARRAPAALRLIDGLAGLFAYGAAAALILLAASVFVDVVGRSFFNAPFTGTLEMTANWWMPTLTLFAFAYTERRQEHIKVTILLDALPLRMRQIVEGAFGVLATALLIALTWYTLVDALDSAGYRETTSSRPPVAIWPFKFVAVAGIGLFALQYAASTCRYFLGHLPRYHAYDTDADLG